MRRLLAILCALALHGCVDIYRGAIVQLTISGGERNSAPGEHYELFAVVNGGVVRVERFKILDSLADCPDADSMTTTQSDLVQRYDDGATRAELCDTSRRLGNIDNVVLRTGTVLAGVRVTTDIDLSEAARVFISIEPDGETDPSPSRVVLGADLADGIAPQLVRERDCVDAYCDSLPADHPERTGFCAEPRELPRARRGVRLGVLVIEPSPADGCNAGAVGNVAVVPAEDETFF